MPMPLRRRVGQVLIGSFTGHAVPVELTALAREFDLGGVTLFARNVESPEQVLEVALTVEEITQEGKDPWGNTRLGASAHTKIKRSDFGLTWNAALEAGGVLVGDEVKIALEVEVIKQA